MTRSGINSAATLQLLIRNLAGSHDKALAVRAYLNKELQLLIRNLAGSHPMMNISHLQEFLVAIAHSQFSRFPRIQYVHDPLCSAVAIAHSQFSRFPQIEYVQKDAEEDVVAIAHSQFSRFPHPSELHIALWNQVAIAHSQFSRFPLLSETGVCRSFGLQLLIRNLAGSHW